MRLFPRTPDKDTDNPDKHKMQTRAPLETVMTDTAILWSLVSFQKYSDRKINTALTVGLIFIHAIIESASHVAAVQCIKSCRYRSRGLVIVHTKHQHGEKSVFCNIPASILSVLHREAGLFG